MEFPYWTPDWVRKEFEADFAHIEDGWDQENDEQSREWLIQLIQSEESRIVWPTFERVEFEGARLCHLAACIWSARWGFGHNAISQADKRAIVQGVSEHAEAILVLMERLTIPDTFALGSHLASNVMQEIDDRMGFELDSFHRIFNEPESPEFVPLETIMRARPMARQVAVSILSDLLGSNLQTSFGLLLQSLESWANRTPLVPKPGHNNAERLYFIRSLTEQFVAAFGRPLRKETLAIASVYFNCDGLDEAAISKLAPVRKRQDESP